MLGTEDDRPAPEHIEQARDSILEGIHRVQAMVGETRRLILNPALAEPPAIAAPALLAEWTEGAAPPAEGEREPPIRPPNPAV